MPATLETFGGRAIRLRTRPEYVGGRPRMSPSDDSERPDLAVR
ncbi:hypothetical protein [Micromonospora sediminimaris]|nr:hypothetical protein [Micromonospora sediminimaris]SFD46796.1 hypothetical protein SAMN05216284_11784 [Micromonospora sediminimaris]